MSKVPWLQIDGTEQRLHPTPPHELDSVTHPPRAGRGAGKAAQSDLFDCHPMPSHATLSTRCRATKHNGRGRSVLFQDSPVGDRLGQTNLRKLPLGLPTPPKMRGPGHMGVSPPDPSRSCSVCAPMSLRRSARRGVGAGRPLSSPAWSACMVGESECYLLDLVQLDRATRAFAARQGEVSRPGLGKPYEPFRT